MDRFLNVLICPHQRQKRVQAELERLTPGVVYMGQLDMSQLPLSQMEWAERREGVFVRWRRAILDASVPRILSGRLNCPVLLAYLCDGAVWGYILCYKGSQTDHFRSVPGYLQDGFADSTPPERRAAWLAQYFPAGKEEILPYLIPRTREEPDAGGPRGEDRQLEDFLSALAPWTRGLLTSGQLTPTPAPPVPDRSSPEENTPDRAASGPPPEREPGPEACLPYLTSVRALGRGWPFPLSRLYALFPRRRPVPEELPHGDWGLPQLEAVLDRFCGGKLDRLELEFTLQGAGTYVRRLKKTVYQPCVLTLELIREKGRCMCLLLDGEERTFYKLIADRDPYMNVDVKDLNKTVFCGQTVEEYAVFTTPNLDPLRREVTLLLSRLERRDGVLSATTRMGVWSCEGLHFSQEQHQQQRERWCIKMPEV